ncbi:MAG: hypothetical protein JWO78_1821 [Micavibrio sp.]|nr:hypothetical protein [Micavibrio sp.]
MANELNEQQTAAPEPELRVAEPIDLQAIEAAPDAAMQDETKAEAPSTPNFTVHHNKNFHSAYYGGDDSKAARDNDPEQDQVQQAISAIRRDPSLIANGATQGRLNQQLASRAAGNNDNGSSVRSQQDRYLAEQRRIEAWNNTQIMVGGVSMTQGQALSALQKINNDPEAYAKRALEEGRIKKGEEEEYKRTAKRMQELMEKDKDGKLSASELQEKSQLEKSRMGEIVRGDIGKTVEKDNAYNQNATIQNAERGGGSYAKSGISDFSVKPEFTAAAQQRQISGEITLVATKTAPEITEQVKRNNATVPGLG